jgi:deazaflavin-dependent oxidoreductase (nitroreductase family)
VSIHDGVYLRLQSWVVTRFLRKPPGRVLRFILRLPILQYRLGLQKPISNRILILTTRGRKTGKLRQTALGYALEPSTKGYLVMTGWGGRSDWFCNATADPGVELWVGKRRMKAAAFQLSPEENIAEIKRIVALDPFAINMLSELENLPFDGSDNWYRAVSAHNPSLRIIPKE